MTPNRERMFAGSPAETMAGRVRIGLALIAIGVVISACADALLFTGPTARVHTIQALQLVMLALLFGVSRRSPRRSNEVAVVGLAGVCLTAAAAGVATDDATTLPLLLIPLVMGSAALLPWSGRQQLLVAAVGFVSILLNIALVDGELALVRHYAMLVATALTFAASVFIAARQRRLRLAETEAERGRAAAELALRRAHAELEQRVRERTEELRLANQALQAEMAERERAESEARTQQAELAHVSRLATMGRMAAEMAHELNQPLAAIGGYAQGCARHLRHGTAANETLIATAEEISRQALRAGEVIRRMTAFARKRSVRYSTRDLREVIDDVRRFLEHEALRRNVSAHVELTRQPLLVRIEPLQIEQVLINLVRNAFDAMSGAADRHVWMTAAPADAAAVEVTVRDSGAGIPAETAARLFEPFYTTKPDGLGLGLSLSRSIVESHGGRLWLASGGGSGTSFRFTLPLAPEQGEGNAPA